VWLAVDHAARWGWTTAFLPPRSSSDLRWWRMSRVMSAQPMAHTAVAPIIQGSEMSTCDLGIITAKSVSGSATNVIESGPFLGVQRDVASPMPEAAASAKTTHSPHLEAPTRSGANGAVDIDGESDRSATV
jgi:hypothetical protein